MKDMTDGNGLLLMARSMTKLVVAAADLALTAREAGDTYGEAQAEKLTDQRCNAAHRAAMAYTNLGGDIDAPAVLLLQGVEGYHSMYARMEW